MGKLILPLTKTHGYADKIVQSSVPDKYIFILSNWKFLIIIGEMSDIKSLPSEARKTLVDNRRTKAIQKRLANTRNLARACYQPHISLRGGGLRTRKRKTHAPQQPLLILIAIEPG